MSEVRAELLSFLEGSGVLLPEELDDDTPLLSSGTLDSLALFNLVLWIEEKTGRAIDPTQMDIVSAWNTIGRIVAFVEGETAPEAPPEPSVGRGACVGGLRIVPYAAEHREAVARFQTSLWSPDVETNLRYLAWKHEDNPYADGPRILLAFDRDELVGMRGFYPSRWQVGRPTGEIDLLVADDLLVRKDHRDQGLVGTIMHAAFEELRGRGVDYLLNLSGGPTTVVSSLAMGWRSAGALEAVGIRSVGQRARVWARDRLARLPVAWRYESSPRVRARAELDPFARFDAHLGAWSRGDEAITLSDTPRVREMAALIEERSHDGRIRHLRDPAYFAWRLRNPLHRYRFVYAGEDALTGYLVLRWKGSARQLRPRVAVADIEARDERVCHALLEAALDAGRFAEITTWRATLPPAISSALGRVGFRPVDLDRAKHGLPCVLVRALDERCPAADWTLHGTPLLDLASWDLRMLSTMAG